MSYKCGAYYNPIQHMKIDNVKKIFLFGIKQRLQFLIKIIQSIHKMSKPLFKVKLSNLNVKLI